MSFKKEKMPVIPTIFTPVFLAVISQLFAKKGLNLLGDIDFSPGFFNTYLKLSLSPVVTIGAISYAISIFFWIYSMTKVDLSFVLPFLSLSYILIILLSWLVLGKNIPFLRRIGVLMICFGLFLISKSL